MPLLPMPGIVRVMAIDAGLFITEWAVMNRQDGPF